jgi:hypothetical protein
VFPLSLKTQKLARFRNDINEGICQQDQQIDQRKKHVKFHLFLLFPLQQKRETNLQSRERIQRSGDREHPGPVNAPS